MKREEGKEWVRREESGDNSFHCSRSGFSYDVKQNPARHHAQSVNVKMATTEESTQKTHIQRVHYMFLIAHAVSIATIVRAISS